MFNNRLIINNSIREFRKRTAKPLALTNNTWKYGTIFAAGSGVAGLSYTLYNAFNPAANSNLHTLGVWPAYAKQRIQGTFGYFLSGIGVTATGAALTLRSPTLMRLVGSNSMFAFLGCIAAMWGTGALVQATPFNGSPFGAKALAYYLHQAVVGAVIAPIATMGGQACLFAAGATAALMAGLALSAIVAPSDAYLQMYGPLNAGMFLMLGACAMSFSMNPMTGTFFGLQTFIIFGGLALFSVKGFADVNRAIDHAKNPHQQFDPINHAVHITMDAINIFIRLAMAMSGSKKK